MWRITQALAGELLKLRLEAPLEHVPYRSGAQAVTDVVAGQVPMLVYQVTAIMPFICESRLRAPAALSSKIVDAIYAALQAALTNGTLRMRLRDLGSVPVGMPPTEFRRLVAADIEERREVIRVAEIKVD